MSRKKLTFYTLLEVNTQSKDTLVRFCVPHSSSLNKLANISIQKQILNYSKNSTPRIQTLKVLQYTLFCVLTCYREKDISKKLINFFWYRKPEISQCVERDFTRPVNRLKPNRLYIKFIIVQYKKHVQIGGCSVKKSFQNYLTNVCWGVVVLLKSTEKHLNYPGIKQNESWATPLMIKLNLFNKV